MMKKLSAILLAATLTLTIGTTAAFAAGHGSHIHYVDANQDNICDYCDQNRLCADEDHDGRGAGNGIQDEEESRYADHQAGKERLPPVSIARALEIDGNLQFHDAVHQ